MVTLVTALCSSCHPRVPHPGRDADRTRGSQNSSEKPHVLVPARAEHDTPRDKATEPGQAGWLMPVIPATRELEIRGSQFEAGLGKKARPYLNE
jgi:hypothetical protein